jgi:hypothetical protein
MINLQLFVLINSSTEQKGAFKISYAVWLQKANIHFATALKGQNI